MTRDQSYMYILTRNEMTGFLHELITNGRNADINIIIDTKYETS